MKNIIITGASNGIGRALAKSLRKKYNVINIDTVKKDIKGVAFYQCDISDKEALLETIGTIKKDIDSLFALINNAGRFSKAKLEVQKLDEWDSIIATNLTAPYILSKEFSHLLGESKGHIINISSTRAIMSEEGTESYSASKGGISSLTHALAISLAHKVSVNSISPGWINTDKDYEVSVKDDLQHPCGRVGMTDDIVDTVKFLLKNKGFITGTDIIVDGGMTKKMIYV